jgi:hypothetical protein
MRATDANGLAARPGADRAPGRWAAVAAIEGVIVIHLVLTPMHLTEEPYVGVLFVVGNALLLVAMALLFSGHHQPAGWLLGVAVCLGELVGFVLSRTVGLPMHYHGTWAAEPEDYLGLASLLCEIVFLTVAVARLRAVPAPARWTNLLRPTATPPRP